MPAKTLILCYDFPPNEGIGGRRWAKLAKGLASRGTEVHVIKADSVLKNQESAWTKDVQHANIKIHSLARKYPPILSSGANSRLGKIQYRLALKALRSKYRGTIYDIALGWENFMPNFALELIKREKIQNLIATGAPFNLLHQAAQIKKVLPHLRTIFDYRDPWLTAVNYGIPQLSYEDFLFEKQKQYEVFEQADQIICPNPFMLEEIKHSGDYLKTNTEFNVLPHFYDQDELSMYLNQKRVDDGKIRLVYGGTLYMGMEPYFERLSIGLDNLKSQNPEFYDKLEIEIYTKDQRFSSFLKSHPSIVKMAQPIGNELFARIAQSDACLIFLAHHNKHYQTTKFFEILPFSKPLVYMGDPGFVSEFIVSEKLGYLLLNPEHDLKNLILNLSENNSLFINSEHEQWSLDSVTAKLEKLML